MPKLFEAMADIKLTTENIQKVIKMFPRDNDWKNLITKHRRDIDALRRGKDLPKKVEDELFNWALDNGEIKTDDVEELEDFIDRIMNEGTSKYTSFDLDEGFSPKDIKMAIGVASDKRYAGGNMSGAVKAIEKIKKGLSDHPQVSAVLKRQNEEQ